MEDSLSGRLMVVSYFGNVSIIRMRLESNKRKQYPNVRTSNLEGSDPLPMIHIQIVTRYIIVMSFRVLHNFLLERLNRLQTSSHQVRVSKLLIKMDLADFEG